MQNSATHPTPLLSEDVCINEYGCYELRNKPTTNELEEYYSKKYFQQQIRMHESSYSDEEGVFRRNKLDQKFRMISNLRTQPLPAVPSFLDVGTGEGFAMAYFASQGWKVTGIDHSSYGCETDNPALVDNLIKGELQASIDALAIEGHRFDVILLDNVLEHLLHPARLLRSLVPLMADFGILVIEVPNDFSAFQNHLLARKKIGHPFWVVAPDHISYFNRAGLARLASDCGFDECSVTADFPIDLFLFNENTNYVFNSAVGKSCHAARIEIENLLHALSPSATLRMYEAMGELEIGRQITGFFELQTTQNDNGGAR